MKNLDRYQNQASAHQVSAFNRGKLQEELDLYKKHTDQLQQQLENNEEQVTKLQREAAAASKVARREQKKSEGLLQRLMDAIRSRNSMRGRLGNMTAQRNRALRQVETLAAQNREVFQQLKTATDKLGEAYQRIGALQEEYDRDMAELAYSYRELDPSQRQQLPEKLRYLLTQIDENYSEP